MRGILRYTLVWGVRYTLGACYLSKNMVFYNCLLKLTFPLMEHYFILNSTLNYQF